MKKVNSWLQSATFSLNITMSHYRKYPIMSFVIFALLTMAQNKISYNEIGF